jgi:hypothetical protein
MSDRGHVDVTAKWLRGFAPGEVSSCLIQDGRADVGIVAGRTIAAGGEQCCFDVSRDGRRSSGS